MKKFIAALLVLAMVISLVACGKKDNQDDNDGNVSPTSTQSTSGNTQNPTVDSGNTQNTSGDAGTENTSDDGRVTDPVKLGESITYWVDGDYLYFKVKTSAEIDAHRYSIDIVNPGIYLTRDSEFINQSIYGKTWVFAEDFDKEYYDGYYVFYVDNNMITGLASDESEWAPGTWSVLLFNEDTRLVLGQWLIVLEGGGKYHFEYSDSFLYGAGEDRKVKEFDSLQDEVESWFTFKPDESYDEWAVFNFDGYYLEQIDPYGYDNYYLFVCPEGEYTTYGEANAVDLTYCGFGGLDYARCPYRFAFEQDSLEPGKYTFVLARDGNNDLGVGGNVEIQFEAEKKGPQDWKMDFSNAKCPRLESKYGVESSSVNTGDDSLPEGDPAEYSREYWEAKYPGENICPFYIEENGKEYSYYWVSGLEGWDGTMTSWINQPFNWNGWHMTADGCIVNKDETLILTDEWREGGSLSSYCTVTTEKYEKSKHDGYPEHVPTAPEGNISDGETGSDSDAVVSYESNTGAVLEECKLTTEDIQTSVGTEVTNVVEQTNFLGTAYDAEILTDERSFDKFLLWLNEIADSCREASTDGTIFEQDIDWDTGVTTPITIDAPFSADSFEDASGIHIVQFCYKVGSRTIYVTCSESSANDNAFKINLQFS